MTSHAELRPAAGSSPADADPPRVGSLVEDTRRRVIGVVMEHVGPNYRLRPPGGGREWDAEPRDVRPLSAAEALTAKVREANRQSRRSHQGWHGRQGWP